MKFILFSLAILLNIQMFGQQKTPKLETFLNSYIVRNMSDDIFSKKEFAYFYAIAITFDKGGKIDTVYFSNKLSPITKKAFNLNGTLLEKLKSKNFQYKIYAGQTVLVPFYHYNASDNSVNYDSGFLNSLENIIPEAVENKPLILLKPIINMISHKRDACARCGIGYLTTSQTTINQQEKNTSLPGYAGTKCP